MEKQKGAEKAADKVVMSRCVHCGETKRLEAAETIDSNLVESHWIYCRNCGSSGPTCKTVEEATFRWNVRFNT